uniref:MIF4G domain-containing protein n=1 Tax=viral metagenome TaxID=1070528 RepID=A0A6C0I8M4_9ZZZZ
MTTTVANNQTMKYNLQAFRETIFHGFDFVIPDDTIRVINYLAVEIGAAANTINPVFQKKEHKEGDSVFSMTTHSSKSRNKKGRGNKFMESNNEDWEQLRSFNSTKIEQKTGLDGHIEQLRSNLNKISEKTFHDIRDKIIVILDEILTSTGLSEEDITTLGATIYDISSTSKFYSKMFADLYSELVTKYSCLRPSFDNYFADFPSHFETIQYTAPEANYDKFCENNKINENRRANSQFFVNLALNGFISKLSVARILRHLLDTIMNTINRTEKKNEVDELTENVAILFNRDMLNLVEDDSDYQEDELEINGKTIVETITILAVSKSKDYKSLSNKAIFKYMDLVEM